MKLNLLLILLVLATKSIASPLPEYPFVVVKGIGKVTMPPEVANFELTVKSVGEDAESASVELAETATAVLKKAAQAGLGRDDIVAHAIGKSQDYSYSRDDSRPRRFALSRTIRLRLGDLSKTGELTDSLLKMKGVEGLHIEFTLRDRQSIDRELDRRAGLNAKANAIQAAMPLDRKVGPAMAVSPIPFESMGTYFGFSLDRAGQQRATPAAAPAPATKQDSYRVPDELHFTKEIYVIFRIE